MASVVINTRALAAPLTGVQRYLSEIIRRLPSTDYQTVAPARHCQGLRGHVWEQLRLPFLASGNLLWSPCNCGPISVRRQVVTVHDVGPLDHPEWWSRRYARWYRWMLPRLIRRCERIIAVSQATRDRIVAHVPQAEEKIAVIYEAPSCNMRPSDKEASERLLKKLGVPSGRYVLSLSSLDPRKNVGAIIAAWNLLAERFNDVHMFLAGGAGAEHVFGRIKLNPGPRLHFLGRIEDEDLPALYSGAEAFVYPSLYEGFGLPPLEAMACGAAVVTSSQSSLPEIVGDAALLVDPASPQAIAEALESLLSDESLQREFIERGRRRAGEFDWDSTANETWRLLQETEPCEG